MLTISIPVMNNWPLTRQCLTTLAEHTRGNVVEVIVVDNASTDETPVACEPLGQSLFDGRFKYLRQERNLNFGPASNLGARAGNGNFVLFLNNDTILTPGWLEPLLDAFDRNESLGAAGPLLMYPGEGGDVDRVQHMGIVFEPQHYPNHLYEFFPVDHPLSRRRRYVQALTGAALMMTRKVFEETGGFHEEYVNGGEDVDLCLQIRRLGLELTCVAESRVYHLASKTPGRNDFEQHNAEVLKRRCVDMIYPDMHRIAAREGYEIHLTQWLRPYLALPERRRQILEKRLGENTDLQVLEDALNKEPLFHAGRIEAISGHHKAGETAKALRHAFLLTKHRQSPAEFRRLLNLAQAAGDDRMIRHAEANIAWFEANVAECGEAAALYMADYMQKLGESRLSSLYSDWLAERGTRAGVNASRFFAGGRKMWGLGC